MSDFGNNLRRLRKAKHLSMDALAKIAGTSKQVLSRYENGERVPKISMVKKLADALGVSISELSGETEFPSDTITLTNLSAVERHLIEVFRTADDRAREDALSTLLLHQALKEKNRA